MTGARARRLLGGAVSTALFVVAILAPIASPAGAWPSRAGGEGLFDVRSADVPVARSLAVDLSGTAYRIGADRAPFDAHDRDVLDGGLSISWGAGGWGELWLRSNHTAWHFGATDVISQRDGRFGLKVASPRDLGRVRTGLAASVGLPWGARDRGFSTGSADPAVTALFTLPLPESNAITSAALHLNLGYRWHGDSRGRTFEGFPWYYLEPVYPGGDKDVLDLRTALELGSRRLTLFVELLLDRILNEDVAWRESPLFLTPGMRWSLSDSWAFSLASKVTLASDAESTTRYRPPGDLYPEWQLGFAVTWSRLGPDVDRDGDGVPDWKDECPRVPEDRDGWQDDDGCPDLDDDGDGIPDEFDGAPRAPEDFDDYLDSDGIPDPDNDGDGILDVDDRCPQRAEDRDGIQDEDGCPEDDADGDGILDKDDQCPEEAETFDGVDDDDGCPDAVGLADPFLLNGVIWEPGEVAPRAASYFELNSLAERMRYDARIEIELRVHSITAEGTELAQRRAEYLKGFLVAAGVAPHRVVASGVGGPSILDTPFRSPGLFETRAVAEVVPRAEGELALPQGGERDGSKP